MDCGSWVSAVIGVLGLVAIYGHLLSWRRP
jgi:hypothetical protein